MSAKKILLIEDNKDIAQLLVLHLRDLQHSVKLCFDGDSGLQYAENYQYALIILDLMLLEKGGLSICKATRKNQHYNTYTSAGYGNYLANFIKQEKNKLN